MTEDVLQQSPAYAAALRLMGGDAEMLPLTATGRRVGMGVVVRRRVPVLGTVGLIARGPVWDGDVPASDRAAALRAVPHLRLIEAAAPCDAWRGAGFVRLVTPQSVAMLNLATRAPHPKWTASLRRAQGAGLRIADTAFPADPAHWLLTREAETRAERRYHGLPLTLPAALSRAAPGTVRLFEARHRGTTLAAMLFVRHGTGATYLTGWSGPGGRAVCAHHLLLDAAATAFAARGLRSLDLGSVDTDAAPGLARFKIGSGADVRTLGGSWVRLPLPLPLWRRRPALGIVPPSALDRTPP